jgi:hypothetical protein
MPAQMMYGQIDSQALDAKRDRIVPRRFTTCKGSSSYYWGIVNLPVLACGFRAGVKKCQAVFEYRNAEFGMEPDDDSSLVDRANNIQWRGFLVFNYSMSRVRHVADGFWGPWEDWQAKKEPRPYRFEHYQYKNHLWFTDQIGPDVTNLPFAANQMVQDKPSCADISNESPHAGVASPPPPRYKPAPGFTGTAEEFAQAFPAFLEKALLARDIDPDNYDKPIKFIVDTVRTCAEVTPQMARNASDLLPKVVFHLEKLDEKYHVCQPTQVVSVDPLLPQIHLIIGLAFMVLTEQYQPGAKKLFAVNVDLVGKSAGGFAVDPTSYYDIVVGANIQDFHAPNVPQVTVTPLPNTRNLDFRGTADDFAKAFPAFLSRAAAAKGLDPHTYEKEQAFIAAAFRTCMKITPQMIRNVTDQFGMARLNKLSDQFHTCTVSQQSVTYQVNPNANPNAPAIWLHMNVRDLLKGQLSFAVSFSGGPSDNAMPGPMYDTIVSGTIR